MYTSVWYVQSYRKVGGKVAALLSYQRKYSRLDVGDCPLDMFPFIHTQWAESKNCEF